MKRAFSRLPIHRKLVVMALLVTTVALLIANVGLIAIDTLRYRAGAFDDALATARVIAENIAAAVVFGDQEAAQANVESVRPQANVRRACVYLSDGSLFAGFSRRAELACPAAHPMMAPPETAVGSAPVRSNQRLVGTVYVENDLADIWARIAVAGFSGLVMLVLAGSAALLLAHRLTRTVSAPIAELAAAARAVSPNATAFVAPNIAARDDEVGDLVRAFEEMLRRVQTASAEREQLLLREREANRLKDEFLAAVSHELRTPLNAIMGWIQILTTTTADPATVARGLTIIARNARAQTRVIEDLLDVSRIVTGKMEIRFAPVDLREAVEHAVEATRASAESKSIALEVDLPGATCTVNGDRDRLQQVVSNVLSNAVKFTPSGGRVAIALRAAAASYEVVVTDTGTGIPASFLPHVFDRFRQADGSSTREYGGLGLGLAIVKEVTERHGGTVLVASDGVGRGSTVTIRLPKIDAARAQGRQTSGDTMVEAGKWPALGSINILAVDDNADSLEVLAAGLTSRGARVRTAATGEAALREWDREPADVMLCDLAMPSLSGTDVLQAVRQRDAQRGRYTSVIAVTAHASSHASAQSVNAGFDAHVSKPYDLAELARTITDVVHRTTSIRNPRVTG